MPIENILDPLWSNLLVRTRPRSEVIGVSGLVRPEIHRDVRPVAGQILKAGPACHEIFEPGVWVVLHSHSGRLLTQEGADGKDAIKLVDESLVLAIYRGDQLTDPLADDWFYDLEPPPGKILVARAEKPIKRGRIEYPDGVKMATRSNEGVVVSVSPTARGEFARDDGVLVMPEATQFLPLGPRGERELCLVSPGLIMARISEPPEEEVGLETDVVGAGLEHLAEVKDRTTNFAEGDPRARR
jgi:hypothetical protein